MSRERSCTAILAPNRLCSSRSARAGGAGRGCASVVIAAMLRVPEAGRTPRAPARARVACGGAGEEKPGRCEGMSPVWCEDDARRARVLADQGDGLTLSRVRSADLAVETKSEMTPVSDADRGAEELIRGLLARHRSRDAVLGEEYGETGGGSRRWVIDPIDGTKNFVRGGAVWAALTAPMDGEEVVVGMVSAPARQRRWWAAKGAGAWTGRNSTSATRMNVSGVRHLEDASFSYSSLEGWRERENLPEFLELTEACWRTRAYGDFWSYMLVAEGAVDIAAEPELELYDMAALVPIVTEAGGTFTDLNGTPGPFGGNAIVTNGLLHDQALAVLAPKAR